VTCGDARLGGVAGVFVGALWARLAGAGRAWPDSTLAGSRCPCRVGRDRPDRPVPVRTCPSRDDPQTPATGEPGDRVQAARGVSA